MNKYILILFTAIAFLLPQLSHAVWWNPKTWSEPEIRYVDRVVEKIVEKPVEVEKIIEKPVEKVITKDKIITQTVDNPKLAKDIEVLTLLILTKDREIAELKKTKAGDTSVFFPMHD